MANTLLEQAVTFIKAGDTENGKQLLVNVLRQNPKDENAWLWMSRCVTTAEQKKDCFERALKINPENQHAIEGLRRLNNPTQPKTPTNPKSSNSKSIKSLFILFVIVVLIVICSCGILSAGQIFNSTMQLQNPSTSSPPKTKFPTRPPAPTIDPEISKKYWSTVDIRALVKNPNNYIGQKLHYEGEVFSIAEDSDGAVMQVWVDVPGGSEFDREAVVVIFEGRTPNIYEGTLVEFWGYGLGAYDGTNAFGGAIRQPAILAEHLTYFR